jgi:hypothetical protein
MFSFRGCGDHLKIDCEMIAAVEGDCQFGHGIFIKTGSAFQWALQGNQLPMRRFLPFVLTDY